MNKTNKTNNLVDEKTNSVPTRRETEENGIRMPRDDKDENNGDNVDGDGVKDDGDAKDDGTVKDDGGVKGNYDKGGYGDGDYAQDYAQDDAWDYSYRTTNTGTATTRTVETASAAGASGTMMQSNSEGEGEENIFSVTGFCL